MRDCQRILLEREKGVGPKYRLKSNNLNNYNNVNN